MITEMITEVEHLIIIHLEKEIVNLKKLKEQICLFEKIKPDKIEWIEKLIDLRKFEIESLKKYSLM